MKCLAEWALNPTLIVLAIQRYVLSDCGCLFVLFTTYVRTALVAVNVNVSGGHALFN